MYKWEYSKRRQFWDWEKLAEQSLDVVLLIEPCKEYEKTRQIEDYLYQLEKE